MKRIPLKPIILALLVSVLSFGPTSLPASAQGIQVEGSLEMIVQAEGSPEALAGQIRAIGGSIQYVYTNVPALLVRMPPGRETALTGLPGVLSVEKDRLVYLGSNPAPPRQGTGFPQEIAFQETDGVSLDAIDRAALSAIPVPSGYVNFTLTGADEVWEQTGYGSGSIVAVVDTGTAPNVCLSESVIGAPGFPHGFNATGDGIPANDPHNHWHGTHVAGVIASACALNFSAFPAHPLYQAVNAFLPWPVDFVPVFGQAPLAQIYPVKVFGVSGGGTPLSVVLKGLDHILSLKKNAHLDIDVVNLSLSGLTLFDGHDSLDRFIKELNNARITVIASASNNGPLPNTIGSPATSYNSIAVGALDYAAPSRVLYEYLGLISGMGAGQGLVMRPTGETRVANFSARGPMSDGRIGPDITAPGSWSFQAGPLDELRWASGTSFSAPNVAGVAALLNAYYEYNLKPDPSSTAIRNALLLGANPWNISPSWRGMNSAGYGTLSAEPALRRFIDGDLAFPYPQKSGRLVANILDRPVPGQVETFSSEGIGLRPGKKYDAIFAISPTTSRVTIEVTGISAPDNTGKAYWPNTLEVYVQSAKRSALEPALSFSWQPQLDGSSFTIEIQDGPWSLNGAGRGYQPLQPGLMKLTLVGGSANQAAVKFNLRIARENQRKLLIRPLAEGALAAGQSRSISVAIPAGVSRATFDLAWVRNWTTFPPSDFDMLIVDPNQQVVSTAGATLNAPERAVFEHPIPGQWTVLVRASEVHLPDTFKLFLTLK